MENENHMERLGVTAEVTVTARWVVFVMGRPEAAGLLKESVFAVVLLPHLISVCNSDGWISESLAADSVQQNTQK